MKLFNRNPFAFFVISFFCDLFCIPHASAQLSVGVEGGYNKNYLVTNNANRAFTNYQPLSGFTVGIPLQYKITDWFAIAADPMFIQKIIANNDLSSLTVCTRIITTAILSCL